MMGNEKKTILHDWHLVHGGNMAGFGGYEMPLWYSAGAKKEHLAVIESAGVFDTSHMALLTLTGETSFSVLQHLFTKDLAHCIGPRKEALGPGRCVYGMFLDENGQVIDDAIVYMIHQSMYMLVVNASMGGTIADHITKYDSEVEVVDYTDKLGKIDIQGKATVNVLSALLAEPDQVFERLIYFSFKGCFEPGKADPKVYTKSGIEILISRTGYTGEFGVEIFVEQERAVQLWNEILDCGKPFGVLPCGLAARDSLRAGAVLPLSHQDIGPRCFGNTPWDFVLPHDGDGGFTKSFLGDKAILSGENALYTYPFAGFDPRKIPLDGNSVVTTADGKEVGSVLTCTTDMAIGRFNDEIISVAERKKDENGKQIVPKGLSCGFVLVNQAFAVGQKLFMVNGKRKIQIEIRDDIRPARSGRIAIKQLVGKN